MVGVRSCYDEGKRVAETLMFDYHRQHGIGKYLAFLVQVKFLIFLATLMNIFESFDVLKFAISLLAEIRIARIFNTYGPRMNIDDGRVVSNFIAQAIRSVLVLLLFSLLSSYEDINIGMMYRQ